MGFEIDPDTHRIGFNPCSFGCQSESWHRSSGYRPWGRVSILVLLDVSLKVQRAQTISPLGSSFNPCSFGCQSERLRERADPVVRHRVSILVLLDVSLKALIWISSGEPIARVSILVLLDVSLKACIAGVVTPPSYRGFNPCSFGCQSESLGWPTWTAPATKCFNPCSFGCQSERVIYETRQDVRWMFQSLFFWMSVWKRTSRSSRPRWRSSFNPCSFGCQSESTGQRPHTSRRQKVSILVLLDVSLKAGWCWWSAPRPACFNPCSFGCQSERVGDRDREPVEVGFQSLFFWMSVWKAALKGPLGDAVVVSILVLLDVSLKVRRHDPPRLVRWVSILVLLDVSLKDVWKQPPRSRYQRFQSLFFWMSVWKMGNAQRSSRRCVMFQSLFFWMSVWKFTDVWIWISWWIWFQSLFFWMSVWKKIIEGRSVTKYLCFNPCSFGCQSERRRRKAGKFPRFFVSILVLLDVSLKVEGLGISQSRIIGFNPCSFGCQSESRSLYYQRVNQNMFQSLFFWMSVWKWGVRDFTIPHNWFQSLFFWMSVWKPVFFEQ